MCQCVCVGERAEREFKIAGHGGHQDWHEGPAFELFCVSAACEWAVGIFVSVP